MLMLRHLLLTLLLVGQTAAAMEENPLLYSIQLEEFELRDENRATALAWDAAAWIGYDRDRFWFKSEGESSDQGTEEFELQTLYARAISPYWNLQLGWRGDFQPAKSRNWASIGIEGLLPGFIHTDATLFVASAGRASVRLSADYDLRLSARMVLQPKLELDWFAEADEANEIGKGLATGSLGVRLRYEFRRELAPYVGFNWQTRLGDTADLARAGGIKVRDFQWLAGIRWWF